MAVFASKPILALLSPETIARFWDKVDRGAPDACWLWTASLNTSGYGRFKLTSYELRHANRVAWIIANGIEPDPALVVRHSCDVPSCCNPAHLLIGTHADNMNDKIERGRWHGADQRGAKNGNATLTIEQIGEIVQSLPREANTRIARRYPVSHSLISRIRTGRSWQREAAQFGWKPAIDYLSQVGAGL